MAGVLRPWLETCELRPDIVSGTFNLEQFAVDLIRVVSNPDGYPMYGDAEQFFASTHPTDGLREMLTAVFGRLSGAGGDGLLTPTTAFGGGKTHSLVALYHLASGNRPADETLKAFIDPAMVPDNCRVAAVSGEVLDPVTGRKTLIGDTSENVTTKTLWGDVAAQLGTQAWDRLEASDAARTAPGRESLEAAIGDAPTLIIIDEIAHHLSLCAKSGEADVRRLGEAVPAFLKTLFGVAAAKQNVVVVLTLATESDAYGDQTAQVTRLLTEIDSVADRQKKIVEPAKMTETVQILKRRLFAQVNADAASEAAGQFKELYEAQARANEQLPGGADDPTAYAREVESHYPFHPELIRVFDKKLSALPDFQRTRGALRLLGGVLRAAKERGSTSVVINIADLDLSDADVANELTVKLGREEYRAAAEADIIGSASYAAQVDAARFSGKSPYATRAATCVFVHSLNHAEDGGATRGDWLLGTLAPGDTAATIEQALDALKDRAWFLHPPALGTTRYVFKTEPTVAKMVAEESDGVNVAHVREQVVETIQSAFASHGSLRPVLFPREPHALKDEATLQLGVMDPDQVTVSASDITTPTEVEELYLNRTALGERRKYLNGVSFVVADADQLQTLQDRVRQRIAIDRIRSDGDRYGSFSSTVRKQIDDRHDAAQADARVALSRCFSHLFVPARQSQSPVLQHHQLATDDKGDTRRNFTEVIFEALKAANKVAVGAPATDRVLQQALGPSSGGSTTTEAAFGSLYEEPSSRVHSANDFLTTISSGISNGSWVYYDAPSERAYDGTGRPAPPRIAPDTYLYLPDTAREAGLIGEALGDRHIIEIVAAHDTISLADARAEAERKTGSEPTKQQLRDVVVTLVGSGRVVAIVDGAPASKTQIRRADLDDVELTTVRHAEDQGMQVQTAAKVSHRGSPKDCFQAISDQLDDEEVATLSLTVEIGELQHVTQRMGLLLHIVEQIPRYEPEIWCELAIVLGGDATGQVEVDVRATPFRAYKKHNSAIANLAKAADEIDGEVRVLYTLGEPQRLDGDIWGQLTQQARNAQLDEMTIEATRA